jgi:hypothetical protein
MAGAEKRGRDGDEFGAGRDDFHVVSICSFSFRSEIWDDVEVVLTSARGSIMVSSVVVIICFSFFGFEISGLRF